MSFVLMTVGKTHSGKTTFGKKLAKQLKHACLLDSDEIAGFLKDQYPDLYNKDYVINSNELAPGCYLKPAILSEVYRHALKTNLPIIFSNTNSTKVMRIQTRSLAKKARRKLIMVYFNLPEDILLKRIKDNKRSKKCLTHSKNFTDLLINKQSKRFESPSKKEADYFFEITDEHSAKSVFKSTLKMLKL